MPAEPFSEQMIQLIRWPTERGGFPYEHVRPFPEICRWVRGHGQIQPYPREQGCLERAGRTMGSLRQIDGPWRFRILQPPLPEAPSKGHLQFGAL